MFINYNKAENVDLNKVTIVWSVSIHKFNFFTQYFLPQ